MGRFTMAILVILAVAALLALAGQIHVTTTTLLRLTDGIGRQFACISSSMGQPQYGFGGVGDTLATDSTVSLGTLRNIKRIKQADDAALGNLLPSFLSSRTQLDSSYMFSKWSAICWAINNHFADSGGISGVIQARAKSEIADYRLSPKFAQVARANGIYIAPKAVYPDSINFAYITLKTSDSTVVFSDSNAIDSTKYGPAFPMTPAFLKGWTARRIAGGTTGACSILVFGSNQNLVHGRRWKVQHDQTSTPVKFFTADTAGDSLYNIDSVKIKACSGALEDTIMFWNKVSRTDSL
jgi:hypothetical protein